MDEIGFYYDLCLKSCPATHQKEVWNALSNRKSIILRAPTGSGKTEAVCLPFLCMECMPKRIIYSLPLRSLANQIADRIKSYVNKLPQKLQVRLQHGERPESVLFSADAVVATIDQVVTSYACTPLTLPVRHGNIPAGAVMSSFLVFDEMHLFDPELGLQATRLICERLNRLGMPYAVLSATLPDSVVEFWKTYLGADPIEAQGEFVNRQVTIQWKDSTLSAEDLKQVLGMANRILVVCNTVDRARDLYSQVAAHAKSTGYMCNLLHSRFLPEDRSQKEGLVVQSFGRKASPGTKALLIATQVVEVGLDISADLLLTEIAPVDALIQRAGRVARWGGKGEVWVYDVENPAPYREDLVNETRQILKANSGAFLDWPTAKKWVNEVLKEPYRRILEEDNAYERVVAQLSRAAFEGSRAQAEAAVRDINTVEVTIHDNPKSLGMDVLRLPTISVHIGIAKKWAKEARQARAEVWRVEVDRNPSDVSTTVNMESITDEDISIGDRLIFPPSVLTYSPDFGLQAGGSGSNFQPQAGQTRGVLFSALQKEGWIEHSSKVVQAMDQVLLDEGHAVSALASLLGISEDEVKRTARLAACLHDLGKLNKDWQRSAGVSASAAPQDLMAHTNGRNYGSFPPHATVSAYALWPALVDGGLLPRQLAKALCFATAHHHSVRAREVPAFEFHPAWEQAVEQALRQCGLNGAINLESIVTHQQSPTNLREKFPPIEYERSYTSYILLSRWLRLADRIATGGPDAVLHYENWFGRL